MKRRNGLRVLLGPFIILIISFFIYFIRYPLWQYFAATEPILVMLILSYLIIFVVAVFLLKQDLRGSLSKVLDNYNIRMILLGLILGLVYLGLWYSISFLLGSTFELMSSTLLRDYETYTYYSLPLAFVLYLGFSIFGAFVEEIVYRGYIQTRISSRYGYVVGILVSTLFFSFQHIHVFQSSWLIQFFQTRFLHVFLFGILIGYLFFKSKENIWSVFSMHALTNAFSVSVPIVVTPTFQFGYHIAETTSFVTIIMLLYLLPTGWKEISKSQ